MAEPFQPPPLSSWEGPADKPKNTNTLGPRKPPPGLAHAAYRGFVSTMGDLDQLAANVAGLAGKLPNTPNFKAASKAAQAEADRRKVELESDTSQGGAPQTTGAKLLEKTIGSVGSIVPYLATEGPIGAGVVGTLQNLQKGPSEAITSGAKSALFSKAAAIVGPEVGKVGQQATRVAPSLSKAVPPFVKRAAVGATTAGLLAPSGERGSQAILGGVAGASQKEPLSTNEIRAAKLQAATGKTGENAWESYRVVGPRLEETASLTGKQPQNVPELLENVRETGKRLNQEFEGYLAPIENQTVFPQTVADSIRNKIYQAEVNGKTKEEAETGAAMEARAREFEKGFTLRELDGLRKIYFERLKGVSSEALKARGNGDIRADRAAEEAIKKLEYDLVDQQAQAQGKPPGYIRDQLKTQQSHLIRLQDALIKRKDSLSEKEGIERGTPAAQRADATLAIHPGGGFVGSLHGIWKKIFGDPDSFSEANKRVSTSFPVKTKTPPNRVGAVVAAQKNIGMVNMTAPDGTTQAVPRDQVDHYKKLGATVVQ